jgi:16S rRNA (guanine527-N7)-methyltransferase
MNFSVGDEQLAELRDRLQSGVIQLGLTATDRQLDVLLKYLVLLNKWNSAFNLSGIKKPAEMVTAHLLDSLAISTYIEGKLVLDIGSGAGLPGVPLAILNPDIHFVLLDSNGKKTRFLFQVKLALGLENISIENKRIEHYQCPEQIDIVVCRAFASLPKLVQLCSEVVTGKCKVLAMKGTYPASELDALPACYKDPKITKLSVPGIGSERHLVEITLTNQD